MKYLILVTLLMFSSVVAQDTTPSPYMDDMTCEKCGACAVASRRSIIGFPAHGSGAKRADLIARG